MFRILFLTGLLVLTTKSFAHQSISVYYASPNVVKMGQSFELIMPKDHPLNFLITTPSGKQFILVSDDTQASVLMNQKDFSKTRKIKLNTAKQVGAVYEDGKTIIEKIFIEKGEYDLYQAENLETEIENTIYLNTSVTIK